MFIIWEGVKSPRSHR